MNGACISLIFQCSPDRAKRNPGAVMAGSPDFALLYPGYVLTPRQIRLPAPKFHFLPSASI